ncbi:microtubule-actin cross-linking factor 1 isoform X33 [Malaya genurostris]|uniref:microtubule-actin cross-linking factor 1 isoform X33 n=1 Tax=Malaya genurostris TaxID=325434 RepID=UPI0026F381A6|nr:microtubule-actin cross-linking factor 1 isoform X33 [Malaya genurostris]
MTTQSYYKDRLGFDPREALYDNNNGDTSPPLKSPQHRHSVGGPGHSGTKHYYNNGGSPSPSGFNNGNGHSNNNNNNGGADYYHRSPAKRHKHSFGGVSPVTGSPMKVTSQDGYEDALTQFKGRELMTIWEHFVWDTIDERDAIQKKTFTKWVNKHLKKHWKYLKTYTHLHVCVVISGIPCCPPAASRRVDDLFEDLRDGHNLLSLLEVLSGEHLPREKGKMRFHMLQNAQMALDFLRFKKIKLVNIRAEDIVDGNPKLTLGLIWTIILHFQISDIVVGQEDNLTAREALLRWARRSTAKYPGVRVNDFTSSWRDGLAFSALIHRNRPDLIDWRDSRSRRPRERLEQAFHVVEREYGVTRLLDPEDVDTNEPDEKSMITYLSSLYDVFPEPPQIHPLFDMESQRRVQEYRELAQQLLYWCREKTSLLQERAFPTTLIELKRLLSDLNRFRSEEVPPRQRDKQRLFSIYKELEKYFESIGEVDVETELRPESLEKAWHRLMSALADRDMILQQEVQRLERLQKLADKVQREYKHTETVITKIETRISEETRRIERLHPVEAKNIVEGLEGDIRHLEQPLQEMNDDCHNLKDGRYPQAGDLHKKVTKLHQRWSQLRTTFHTSLVQKLSGLSYPVQETTITKQTRVVTETRQIGTNPYFRDVQEYTEWCQSKLKQLLTSDYGSDLPSAKVELERHQHEHKVIDQFHSKIVQSERHQSNFTGDELQLYQQKLSQLQKIYAELLSTSTKRLSDLDALQDFLSAATSELSWLNDREQIEVSRDWADKNLDLSAVHRYYESNFKRSYGNGDENLMSELEKREMHFATILDRGEALLVQQHPASKCIEGHLQALQSQWSWLLQLTLCLEVHLKHATDYHSFYDEIREAENWLAKRDDILNTKYSQSEFSLDQGEALLRGMQDIREELNAFGETVAHLQHQATTIVPLKQRKQPVNRQCTVQTICSYKQGNISLEKNESCTLLDTSGRVKWRVKTAKGVEGSVHGVCLLLPPPDQEAIDAADRLKRLFDRSVALWQKKQLRLRQNMIFATIKVVKGWDFEQFLAMGAEQRTAIRRALNDDADKLLAEGDPADPQLRRLRREMDEVNRLFDEFEKRARAEEESKQASRIFTEQCISLKTRLEEMARELDHIILSPMPRDLDSLEHAVQILDDYKRRLGLLEPDLKHLQETFRTIALKTPALKKSLDNLLDLWKELNAQAGLHGDRLKLLEGALAGLEDNEQVISDLEGKLSRQLELPSTQEGLYEVFKKLSSIQETISSQQPEMDKMNDSADQLGRMGVPTKVLGDLKRLHSNVERLNSRWNNLCGQLAERLRSVESAIGLMKNLQTSIVVEEMWVEKQTEKLQALPTATSARELDTMLGEAMERAPKIEQVNLTGGRLIREAKIYDGKCLHYIDWLVEIRPSFSPPRQDLRPPDTDPGATEVYSKRLDTLNGRYESLIEQLTKRLKTAIEVNGADGLRFAESLHKPLRTYRVEFNLGRPTGSNGSNSNGTDGLEEVSEDVFTSTYSATRITKITNNKLIYDTTDSSRSENSRECSPTKKVSKTELQSDMHHPNEASSVQFTEIRSLKRISRTNEAVGTNNGTDMGDTILNTPGIVDPMSGRILTVGEAIKMRILDVRSGQLNVNGERLSLEEAARRKLIDAELVNNLLRPGAALDRDGRPMSLLEVIQKEILEAENGYDSTEKRIKQAVVEKFALCEDHLSKLLEWITKVEQDIASVGGPKERVDDLRNQINSLKQIKDDIDVQSRPVASCLEQVRQLVLTGGEVLSAPEVAALESSGRELRSRVDKAQDRTGKLLRRLGAARDELGKLRSELDTFSSWLQTSRRTLEDKENTLSDLNRLSTQSESVKEFHGDVVAHQADLRFITMSAQKFVDECKDYLSVLNDFRTTLPERLPHIEQISSSDSPIRQEVSLVTAQYRDLLNRANALLDRLAGLGGRQRDYQEALEKARSWLRDVHPRVSTVLSDPIAADPQSVQDQMNQTKSLQSEFLSQGRLIDNVQHSLDALLKSLAGRLSPSEVSALEIPVEDVKDKYNQLLDALADRSKLLDTALVQSQGVQDALDGLSGWINQSEDKFKLQNRPASLIKERLIEQVREHRGLLNDLESHRTSLESVTLSARELMSTASNARLAKRIETNLSDVTGRFEKLLDKALKRGEFLEDTLAQLNKFNDDASILEQELSNLQEALEGRELTTLPAETLTQRMIDLTKNKEHLRPLYESCVKLGKDLIAKRDVTDTGVVRDRIKALENSWKNLEVSLEEKLKLSKQKAEQLNAYEEVKDHVLVWLSSIETRTNNLAPVAVDVETIKYQIEEVKPLIKEHRDYAVTIDKVNDLGAQYDALIRPDSPNRKRSVYSPIKRSTVSPMRRLSGEARSPSPTKGLAVGQSPTVSPLSPGGSSGFGSRRSSQDGFQLTDLTPIQQQLTEINNRYSLVGARLNDRQNELDSVRDEVRKHQESLKTLSSFLDKIQRQVPKDVISNKDEAERCNKQARKVLEEMYEKQSLLDSTKAQVKDLLKRKPDVQGADRLRTELESVADRWKNLHDLCKDRINFSEQLRDFLDTHDNLNGWLTAKERMLTVLGPISSDPRMVQSQVQQVQVLREEFRGQQPQLNHLQEVGNAVLEYLRDSSLESQSVSTKLKNVQRKWDDLVGRLDERAQSLGAAADTSKEFDAGLNRLREALQNISDNLDALPTDRDHQETLRKIENLERQLEGQRPLLADSEAAAEALCRVLSDPASRADVNARVVAVGKQYQNLQKKLDHRKAETDSALRDGRQFAETCARTLGWLSGELGNLTDRLLVSAHRPTLQHQIDTHEPVYREVMSREHEVIMLLNKGRELQEKPEQSPDRTVQRDLEKISQQWERLRNAAVDRQTRLQTCMEHCKKHAAASESFLTWLRGAEDKLASFKPGILKKSQLDQQLKELQTFRSDVWKRSGEYESTRGLGESFIGACDIDKEPIKAELQDMKDRWERLNNELLLRAQTLEACAKRLGDFNEELRDLDHAVSRCEDRLAAHDALGGAAKDPKLLDRVKTIKDDAVALKKPLQAARKMAGDIAVEARAAGGDAEHLKSEVDGIADRIEDLHARLDDRCGELQSAATAVTQFNDAVKALGVDLNDLESQIDSLSPPAREIKTVINQLDEVASILSKIERISSQVGAVERAGEQLVDSGFAPDTVATRDQIGSVRKQLGKLENRTRDHDDALQKALKALQKFYDLHQNTLDNLNDVADQVKKLKPVSSELEQIRHQQEDFRRFKQRYVEPLVVNIDEVNRTGQDLIRSAQGGVPTGVLEKDLEKINDKWNDLKEKMNERDRRLDVGLLQSGKFQEALDGLSKWLKDTEEMVANQKPPSADYKVVKAQLQEQKFLTKMLMDRQNSMSSLFQLGQEVAAGCEPSEKAAIERQLKELMGRFDALTDAAQTRTLDLEQAMHVAKQFQDQLNPLTKWLDGAERAVKAMELVPTDEEKIQQRIIEHERLHDEILSKQPDFSELADIAGQLMELVGDDEGVVLSEKVKNTTDRYTDLVQASENIGQILNDSRQGLRHLVLTYQDLVSWMENMENRLQRFRVIPVHTEKLLEQMDVLVELNEDIASRSPNVESTVEAGSELMKHISSDEALQLKDKLDSLQRRYGELTTKGGDLLKHAQDALPLVQQFHQSHIRLVDWMQAAESTLATGDSNEIDIVRLEGDLSEMRPVLEAVNSIGPQLCQISPGEGASTIEGIVTRDNRRFEAIVEQIQRKAERLHLSKQRSNEVTADIDELLEWFRDMDATLRDAEPPAMTPKLVRAQLQEHRSINDDISSQKGRVRDVTSAAKKVLRESQPNNNTIALREKLEDLKEVVDTVAGLCSNRLAVLEQALPLSEHFADSHSGLVTWLNDMEHQISMLAMPALRLDQIAIQQDKNERLTQSIAEHKPLLDKLNKTGEALIALVADDDAAKISEIVESDNARYAALRTELRERQNALEQALQESSQFSDKLEGMLRALQNTAEQANQADPISAHPPKIRDQIEDNAALIEDIDKRGEAFAAVKRAATDVISKASNQSDPAVRDIKKKLDKLNNLWNELQKTTSKRGASLENTLAVAEKFWKEMQAVMETLKELQEALQTQEPPAAQPQAIQKQQVALQEIRQEIDQTKPEVEQVRRTGSNLMSLCGEPDKPEVKKHIEDLDHAWDNITALYAKREENLIDAMEKAMEFHETLQNLLNFLAKAEDRFQKLGPLGSDIEAVKKQIEQLKHFKDDVDPHMVEVEALNRQAIDLTERTSAEQASAIREPLNSVNRRWENLLRGMVERQKQLEHALLHLGQFQHALNELLVWISKTDANLDELKPIPGDPQLLEVELAKLKVLANDIHAHQSSVDTLNDAGRRLIENDRGSLEASTTQDKLQQLNKQWRDLLQKAADRQHELEEALREAQGFTAEIQDLLGWLGDVDAVIGASKPVGGLPETASEQLERFMEVYNELEENRPKVETLIAQGQEYVRKQTHLQVSASNLQHTLRTLKQRWDAVVSRASDKKIKLEIALKEATEFHDALQAFVEWLTQAEKQLSSASAVSRVLETIQQQMEEHKTLQKDVSIHRESMLLLDKKGTHLKYFSQKQDVILIKNLLVSVQHRWERVVAKAAERTRALDHGYKEAREFHDAWLQLTTWLKETETTLDTLSEETTNDAIKIKKHLEKLREIQRHLQSKESFYDSTMRNGKGLMDRAPKTDEPVLSKMMNELKDSWKRVCHKSVERQRKFEEALLLSGQFADALQALLEWLRKAKTRLSEDGPVHGDLDTVTTLFDHHKQLESDLDKRSAQMQTVMKTGKDLEKSDETRETSKHLKELQKLWEDVQELSARRKSRLEVALKEAERLHKSVHMLLEWLSEAEQKLRFVAAAPDDEAQANDLLDEHARFMKELREKEYDKEETLGLANAILGKAHPDAIPIIKNWISIIQSRWDEISQWALNRQSKLEAQLKSLKDLDDSIEELLAWLAGLEATLLNLEQEPLPDEIPPLEALITDHKEFMENTARRQSEVDRACKPRQPPPGLKEARKPSRGVLKTPVRGSQPDLREHSPDYGTLGRKQSFKGSRDQGLNSRRTSRVSPGRETQTPERDRLPHYGPRFLQSNQPETELRSPRAKLLWDKWRYVWMLAWERQRRLHDHLLYLQDLERVRQFSWEEWRKRFLKFMNHKKSRLTDLFRKMDKDNNGLIPREVFIDGIIGTKFDTSKLEMNAVADLFDRNGEGLIDWQEFIAALRPDWQDRKPATDADKIHDEVKRLVMLCTCRQKFRVFQVGEGKYRFGDSQKLRLVRILRSTVMVRVGGGWVALDEFLVKNDPCRVALVLPLPNPKDPRQHEACCPLSKGRTNIELREQFILADGVSQSMAAFKPRMSGSAGSGSTHAGSPIPTQGPIVKVRERSSKSISMSRPSRSSLSASTPDSLSDNESSIGTPGRFQTPNRKTSVPIRSQMTPGGSRTNSRPSSRPASRAGSKPPSRHGSTLSLDSTDDATPSRIPTRRITSTTTPRPSRLSVGSTSGTRTTTTTNGVSSRTASGAASPAPTRNGGMSRSSSIPTLIGLPNSSQRSRIPVRQTSNVSNSSSATGKTSGTSTPSGMQTPRRTSVEPQTPGSVRPDRSSRGTTPIEKRAPFRL